MVVQNPRSRRRGARPFVTGPKARPQCAKNCKAGLRAGAIAALKAFSSEVGTGSRKENAIKKKEKHFQAKWAPVRVKKMRSRKKRSIFKRSGHR
ncbi:MAG: hypothetical protein IOC43_02485, partial [Methylobacterium sp.]|nr:hypothetical protein [Methylobacterium sp.]